jgi:hypothetical protein
MSTVRRRRALVEIASADGNDVTTFGLRVRAIREAYVASLRTLAEKAQRRRSDSVQALQCF